MVQRLEIETPAVTELPLGISDHLQLRHSLLTTVFLREWMKGSSDFQHINVYRGRADALCPCKTAKFRSRRIIHTGGPGSPGAPGCPSQPCCPRCPGSPGSPSGPLSPLCPGNKSQKDIQALVRSGWSRRQLGTIDKGMTLTLWEQGESPLSVPLSSVTQRQLCKSQRGDDNRQTHWIFYWEMFLFPFWQGVVYGAAHHNGIPPQHLWDVRHGPPLPGHSGWGVIPGWALTPGRSSPSWNVFLTGAEKVELSLTSGWKNSELPGASTCSPVKATLGQSADGTMKHARHRDSLLCGWPLQTPHLTFHILLN